MDNMTIILFVLLTAALFGWLKSGIEENRSAARELQRKQKDALLRAERVRQLVNKQQ